MPVKKGKAPKAPKAPKVPKTPMPPKAAPKVPKEKKPAPPAQKPVSRKSQKVEPPPPAKEPKSKRAPVKPTQVTPKEASVESLALVEEVKGQRTRSGNTRLAATANTAPPPVTTVSTRVTSKRKRHEVEV